MAFTNIPNSDIDPGSPLTTGLMTALRDNDEFLLAQTKGLVLVEKKLITADVTTITFSSLDGDTDEVYLLVGKFKFAISVGGVYQINLDPNALTTNQGSVNVADTGLSIVTATRMAIALGTHSSNDDSVNLVEAMFHARKDVNSVALERVAKSGYTMWNSGNVLDGGVIASRWNENSTNLTSLRLSLTATGGDITTSGFRDGSAVALYKLRQS